MANESVKHLRSILESETDRLTHLTEHWQDILDNTVGIPEDVEGQIRALIGQGKLLTNDKFYQFKQLLNAYDNGNPDMPMKITVTDLEGFWDTTYIQVDDIVKKCHFLHILKRNNWIDPAAVIETCERAPLASISNSSNSCPTRKKLVSNSKQDHRVGARKRLADVKLRLSKHTLESTAGSDVGIPTTSGLSDQDSDGAHSNEQDA